MSQFSTEGFDLDAVPSEQGDDVVYEVGGGATFVQASPPVAVEEEDLSDSIATAESLKQQGNAKFKAGSYLEAHEFYTDAIEACPGELKGEEILKLRDEFEEAKREEAYSRNRQAQEELRQRGPERGDQSSKEDATLKVPEQYVLPQQDCGEKLSIYYCNRAASLLHMNRFDEATKDCDVAVLLNPKYAKAFVRRSVAYEKAGHAENALRDAKKALELDPSNTSIRKSVARLQKIEDERLEKLKEETIGKLKDLGNSILGNFGLSLDNFNTVQDPKTGSYNIQFNQNS